MAAWDAAREQELVRASQPELDLAVVARGLELELGGEQLPPQPHQRLELRGAHAVQTADGELLQIRDRQVDVAHLARPGAHRADLRERLAQHLLDERGLIRQLAQQVPDLGIDAERDALLGSTTAHGVCGKLLYARSA